MTKTDLHIYLIGFSGSGKSTVGPKLAKRLKRPFVDIDDLIAQTTGMIIPDIFRILGEPHFRREEQDAITRAADNPPSVIAVGGGAFETSANRNIMQQTGRTVYLSCARREIYRRLKTRTDRPLLETGKTAAGKAARIRQLLDRRMSNYRRADITVSTTTKSVAQTVDQVILKLEALDG